jgi:uncharacterized repeat protein (TIGR03803 family)
LYEFSHRTRKPLDLDGASDGALYGTTVGGGVANWGVIYRIDPTTGELGDPRI